MNATERQVLLVTCKLLGTSFVQALEKLAEDHRQAYQQVNVTYQSIRREAIQEATAVIDAQLVNERAEVATFRHKWDEAQEYAEAERIAEAEKGIRIDGMAVPLGTKVQRTVEGVTIYGLIEIRRDGTKFPETKVWDRPSAGGVFVRLLKKDGTPGLRFYNGTYGWEVSK